jgi:uncharacterized protein YjiS (DUF1127 family)
MAYLTNSRASRPGVAERVATLWAAFKDSRRRRALYGRTLRELNALTDRELSDLGIARIQIEDVAREAAYGT